MKFSRQGHRGVLKRFSISESPRLSHQKCIHLVSTTASSFYGHIRTRIRFKVHQLYSDHFSPKQHYIHPLIIHHQCAPWWNTGLAHSESTQPSFASLKVNGRAPVSQASWMQHTAWVTVQLSWPPTLLAGETPAVREGPHDAAVWGGETHFQRPGGGAESGMLPFCKILSTEQFLKGCILEVIRLSIERNYVLSHKPVY